MADTAAATRKGMALSDLKALLEGEKADALSAMQASKLSEERSKALDYYNGEMPDMPAPPDRSKAVSSDVADTVEGLMPSLMEIFASGDDVVEFQPVGAEDEEAAQQETDYVNHVFMQKNPGFVILYTFIKDALLSKNGVVKVWWEETEQEEQETYEGLSDDAYALVKQDEEVEIVEHTEYPAEEYAPPATAVLPGAPMGLPGAPMGDPMATPPALLHDVTVVKRKTYGCAKVYPVPPEEFGISRRAKSVNDANYCFHEVVRTQADLIAAGYDPNQVKSLATAAEDDTEESQSRDTVDDDLGNARAHLNEANRPLKTTEHYVVLDYYGDGKACIYRIVTAGESGEILYRKDEGETGYNKPDVEKVDVMPFAAMTPVIVTHRFFGRSIADLVMDIQRIKTSVTRAMLDNLYLLNNQRMEIAESHAGSNTIDDLLTNRPGGIVRTKQPGGLTPIINQPIGQFILPTIEYLDKTREWRTGVTRQGQGLNPDSLQNIGEQAVLDAADAARAKTKLIARIFAETGIRDMFLLLHGTIRKNDRQQNTVRLRNEWVSVDPRQWKTRTDMTVNVGLGSGSKAHQMAFLMQLLQVQREAIMAPQLGLVEPGNIYNSLKKLVKLAGEKSVEPYFMDPDRLGPDGQPIPKPEPPPDPKMKEIEAKIQLEQARLQMDAQKAMAQGQMDQAKMQAETELRREQSHIDAQLKREQSQADAQLKRDQALTDRALKQEQMLAEMALKERQMQAEMALKERQLVAELELKRELGLANAAVKASVATSDVNVGGEPG